MLRILGILSAAPLMLAAAPAAAQEAAPTAAASTMVAPAVDAERLAAARVTVDHVFPLGTYAKIMNGTMDQMMDSVMASVGKMPIKDLAGMGGVDASKLSSVSLAEIQEVLDPHYKERMQIVTHTMMVQMTDLMTQFEPDIRDGMAEAYAAKYTAAQLKDINTFFATPSGNAFAGGYYTIMMSPEVMSRMQAFMPRMMQQMPEIMKKVMAATADLPKPRTYADLGKAERNKLAELLGVSVQELDQKEAAKGK